MILNAEQLSDIVVSNGKGKPAQVGYDLTLHSVNKINGGQLNKDSKNIESYSLIDTYNNCFHLTGNNCYSLTFEQGIKVPSDKTAFIHHRSSLLRMGGLIISGVYDPGFEVNKMGAVLFAMEDIRIEKGARVAQVVLHENYPVTEELLYDGQYQGEKDVK